VDARFGAYLLVAALLIVTPGPDTALLIRNGLRGGFGAASLTALGVTAGILAWGTAAAAGLAALLAAWAWAAEVLRFASAVLLVVLGARSLRAALAGGRGAGPGPPRTGHAFLQGLLNNLLNPKAAAIFIGVVPQFVRPGDPPARLAAMVLAFGLMVCLWLHLYGLALAGVRDHLGPRFRRGADAVTGTVLIALGVRVAA
jgi:threonine/homoserine/homoserine lactone efflux protein